MRRQAGLTDQLLAAVVNERLLGEVKDTVPGREAVTLPSHVQSDLARQRDRGEARGHSAMVGEIHNRARVVRDIKVDPFPLSVIIVY